MANAHRIVAKSDGKKVKTIRIVDRVPTEVLIMTLAGKMIARNSADDARDPVRRKRYESYRERVKEARDGPALKFAP